MAIDKIRIQGVRGIRRELTLDLGGNSLVLRGDNGTGKSSIVAGLLWALRGEEEPSTKAKPGSEEAYHANVLGGAGSAQVILDFKGDGSITVKPDGVVVADDKGKQVRAGCERSTPFLLRKQLLRFLEDKPVNRFKYLEAFLDLEEADEVRAAFGQRADQYSKEAEKHRQTREAHLRTVAAMMPRESAPSVTSWSSVVTALGAWATALGVSTQATRWEDMPALAARLGPLLAGDGLARSRLLLATAKKTWEELAGAKAPSDPAPLIARRDGLLASATDGSLATMLEEAGTHIETHPEANSCPVCEQTIDAKSLAERLAQRVRALADLKKLAGEIVASGVTWRTYWLVVLDALTATANAKVDVSSVKPPPGTETLRADLEPASFAAEVARAGGPTLISWTTAVRAEAVAAIDAAIAKLPTEEDTSSVRKLCQAIELAEKARLAVTVAEASAEDAAGRAQAFTTLSEALRAARQDVAKELLEEISTLVTEFYGIVHPQDADDEITGPPEIHVKRHAGGTAHVRGQFHKKAVDDPRWVYSDGHLDTVGICVYLALRRFRATRDASSDPKMMILDDIVLSIDLGHGRRLLDLLRTRFADHQVLIFTHNGLFSDWCVEKLPGYKRKAISRWTVETGPQLGEYPSMMERIEQQIATETSPKLLAQAVMNLMDEWLAQARFEYELSVRARRGEEYTLTDIWNPFTKRLKELEKGLKTPIGDLSAILADLGALVPMRNRLAAHENEFAHEFPLDVVRQVAQRSVDLVRLLYCPKCPSFALPVPNAEAPDLLRCRPNCEHIRYDRPRKAQPAQAS
jgi:AAA domain